ERGETISLDNPAHILAITYDTRYKLPSLSGNNKKVFVVTALDRMGNESVGKKKKVTLKNRS
ncbi:MAG: hypothetical protein KH425_09490, partial [Prevotella bivia]|nr:hypothetical protein [Prevotella bivia]